MGPSASCATTLSFLVDAFLLLVEDITEPSFTTAGFTGVAGSMLLAACVAPSLTARFSAYERVLVGSPSLSLSSAKLMGTLVAEAEELGATEDAPLAAIEVSTGELMSAGRSGVAAVTLSFSLTAAALAASASPAEETATALGGRGSGPWKGAHSSSKSTEPSPLTDVPSGRRAAKGCRRTSGARLTALRSCSFVLATSDRTCLLCDTSYNEVSR
jgi:hypothetical protein